MKFVILGEPVPKGRPHLSSFGGHARAYTPAKTRKAEDNMRAQIVNQLPKDWIPYNETPLSIHIFIFRSKPKSISKKRIFPVTKPDLDNFIKSILDAMNSVVFRDDSIVCKIEALKNYDDIPRIEIWVDEL